MPPDQVAAVRRFNRFYTRQMGLLDDGLLHSPLQPQRSARALRDRAPDRTHRERHQAGLGLDPGYLSRLLQRLRKAGLVSATAAAGDRRQRLLGLAARGRRTFGALDARSSREVALMLGRLTLALPSAPRDLHAPGGDDARPSRGAGPLRALRTPGPGDLGWVVQRHGELYAAEYEWNEEFEALVARIVAEFAAQHEPQRERAWIAELDSVRAGSVFLVRQSDEVAKLQAAAGRALGAGPGAGPGAGGGLRRVRPGGGLSDPHTLDQFGAGCGAPALPAGRIPSGRHGAAPELRPRAHVRNLGARGRSSGAAPCRPDGIRLLVRTHMPHRIGRV